MNPNPRLLERLVPADSLDLFYRLAGMYQLDLFGPLLDELAPRWDELYAHSPLRPQLHRIRGYSRQRVGDLAGALEDVAAYREIAVDMSWSDDAAKWLHDQVTDALGPLRSREDFPAVERLCRAALAVYGPWQDVEYDLAVALDLMGRSEEAEPLLRALVDKSPLAGRNWSSLTIVLRHQGRFEEALATAREGERRLQAAGLPTERLERTAGDLAELVGEAA